MINFLDDSNTVTDLMSPVIEIPESAGGMKENVNPPLLRNTNPTFAS